MSRAFTLRAHLEHLAILSWPAEREKIAAMLPAPLVPQTIDRAQRWGLVSMAIMRDTTFGATYAQLNERTYVMLPDGSGKGAFFWRSLAATRQAVLVRSLVGAPEFVADLSMDITGDDYVFKRDGRVVAHLDLARGGRTPSRYDGLDVARAQRLSSTPKIGYTLNWGRLCATRVIHTKMRPRRVTTVRVNPTFMIPAAALDAGSFGTPLLAVYQRETPFWVDVPPRPIAGGGHLGIWSSFFRRSRPG
jgi:hypothetical protein